MPMMPKYEVVEVPGVIYDSSNRTRCARGEREQLTLRKSKRPELKQ